MMKTNRLAWLAFFGASVLAAHPAVSQDAQFKEEGKEQRVDMSKVPPKTLEQAKKTLDGKITDVYLVEMAGQQVYELEGTDANGAEIAVYVSSDGEVVKAEKDTGEKDGEEQQGEEKQGEENE